MSGFRGRRCMGLDGVLGFVKVVVLIRVAYAGALTITGDESPASVRTPGITYPRCSAKTTIIELYLLQQQLESRGHAITPTTDLNLDHTPATLVSRLWNASLLSRVVGAWQRTRVISYPRPVRLPAMDLLR